jgi:hypothetical protein
MVESGGVDEDYCSDGEDARGEFEDTLTSRGAQESAETAAVEEIVRTGEGGRVGKVDVAEARAQGDEDDADDEDDEAGKEGDADEGLGAPDAEDEEGPEEVELLFDLKGPEVVDVEVRQDKWLGAKNCEICSVGKEVILPA